MRTHKDALYVRKPGDKFRSLKVYRPTLRQVKAKLKILGRRIALVESRMKEGQDVPAVLKNLWKLRDGVKGYLANIGREMQEAPPKSSNLRLGARKHQPAVA